MAARVLMYATDWCGYCARARQLLESHGAALQEIDVEAVEGAYDEMRARSGGRSSVPQIFINDQHVGGSDELAALEADGRLATLLK